MTTSTFATGQAALAAALWRAAADQEDDDRWIPETFDRLPEWAQAAWEDRAATLLANDTWIDALVAERLAALAATEQGAVVVGRAICPGTYRDVPHRWRGAARQGLRALAEHLTGREPRDG